MNKDTSHVLITAATLGFSAFIAFGPYRHRLPKALTRFARFSMAFKLGVLAVLGASLLWHNITDGGPMWLRVVLTIATAAFGVISLKLAWTAAHTLHADLRGKGRPAPTAGTPLQNTPALNKQGSTP